MVEFEAPEYSTEYSEIKYVTKNKVATLVPYNNKHIDCRDKKNVLVKEQLTSDNYAPTCTKHISSITSAVEKETIERDSHLSS